MVRETFLTVAAMALLSCQGSDRSVEPASATPAEAALSEAEQAVESGRQFAVNRCADCHAVETGQVSANPSAPEFEAVANAPGLTRASLTSWLNTSHDFPREMYFAIPEEKIDDLVSYMLTLRREDYEPMVR